MMWPSTASGNLECLKLTALHRLQVSGTTQICDTDTSCCGLKKLVPLHILAGWTQSYHGAILTDLTTWALTPPFVYVREECHAFKLLLDSKAVSFLILSLLKKLCLFITQCSCARCSAIPWFFKQHPSFVAGVLVTSAFYPGCTYLWACIWDWFLSNLFHHSLGLPCCHCSSSSVFHPFLLFTS